MNIQRLFQVLNYGWQHAGQIEQRIRNGEPSLIKGRFRILFDIISCYHKYSLWSNQYLKDKFYNLDEGERSELGSQYKVLNKDKARWTDYYYRNQSFLNKWSGQKYECSYKLSRKRNLAYTKQYQMGANCEVRQNVILMSTHHIIGNIKIGYNCLLGRGCDIDYTGGLTLLNDVAISENVIIMTHNHHLEEKSKCVCTPLIIQDRVWVGAAAIIMPGVIEIGRGAVISAGAIVKAKVPPYAVVMGNPAKIVGFIYTPEEVVEYEKNKYPENERTNIERYTKQYEKYFINRMSEIKKMLNN